MKTKLLAFTRGPFWARGFHRPTAVLLAGLFLTVFGVGQPCLAGKLLYEETFDSNPNWLPGGGGGATMVVLNGQAFLRHTKMQPTNPNDVAASFTSFAPWWSVGNTNNWHVQFRPGRTVELRTDAVQFNQDDVFAALGVEVSATGYLLILDRNEIALVKYGLPPGGSFFSAYYFWEQSKLQQTTNLILSAAFTPVGADLVIHIRVLDKTQQTLLWQKKVTDTSRSDPVLPNRAVKGILMQPEVIPAPELGMDSLPFVGICWCNTSNAPTGFAEVTLDNVQALEYYAPHLEIAAATNTVALTWQTPFEEHIVVEADPLAGPWRPCPQPHARIGDTFCLVAPCLAQRKFFKLTPGRQFTDDFSSLVPSWTPWFQEAGEMWIVTNGVLRVSYAEPEFGGFALCPLGATNAEAVLRDFCVSVDTLDWVTSGTNWSTLGLFGRGRATSGTAYFGGIGLNYLGASPGHVTPWYYDGNTPEEYGDPFDMAANPPPYRVQFSGVGNRMLLRVLSLTTGAVIREMPFTNSAYATGVVGLWFNGRTDPGDSYTNTLDNFILIGTK